MSLVGDYMLKGVADGIEWTDLFGSPLVEALTGFAEWSTTLPNYCAHRGGSADWPEETLYAYANSAAWSDELAMEVSVWQSSDGVWVCSHDQSTARMFGTDYDIPTTPWTTLQSLVTTVGGKPIAKFQDVLDLYGGNRLLFVDNKGVQSLTAWLDLLDSSGGSNWFVGKAFAMGATQANAYHARGYKTWGYFYEADTTFGGGTNLANNGQYSDMIGMDYNAAQESWDQAIAFNKPILGHIVPTAAAAATAFGKGATGLMVSGVMEVVPQ